MNGAIADGNWVEEAALSGGAFDAGAPRDNLKTRDLDEVAASATAADGAFRVDGSFAADRLVRFVGGFNHNLGDDGQWRWTGWTDASRTVAIATTGLLPAWPSCHSTAELSWQASNWYQGRLTPEQRAGYSSQFGALLDQDRRVRHWTLELFDPTNAAGTITLGSAWASALWLFNLNFGYPFRLGFVPGDTVEASDINVDIAEERPGHRTVAMQLEDMDRREAEQKAFELKRRAGAARPVVWMRDAARLDDIRNFMIARVQASGDVTETNEDIWSVDFTLKEIRVP